MRAFLLLFLWIALGACERNTTREWVVNYRVVVRSGFGTYRVTYLTSSGAQRSVGPVTSSFWISPNQEGFEDGSRVSMTVETLSGSPELRLEILRQTAVHESGIKPAGAREWTISDQL